MSGGFRVETFLEMLSAEAGLARNTLDAYARDLDDFSVFLAARGVAIDAASPVDVADHLAELAERGLSAASQARHLSTLRRFHRFLYAEGFRGDDPTGLVDAPEKRRPLPKILSVEEVDRLIEAAATAAGRETDADGNPLSAAVRGRALRLHAALETIYASGLRVSELVSLPAAAARSDDPFLMVRGKGDKERLVPLSQRAKTAIAAHAAHLRTCGRGGSRWLFPSWSESGHVTRQAFARDLKELAAAVGLRPDLVSPHVLRHAFASHILANGADLRVVQQLLGHADIATTEIYTHVLDERLRELVESRHPLAGAGAGRPRRKG
jgi:integrase/recombinase XerD